jgi:hypothetical protein
MSKRQHISVNTETSSTSNDEKYQIGEETTILDGIMKVTYKITNGTKEFIRRQAYSVYQLDQMKTDKGSVLNAAAVTSYCFILYEARNEPDFATYKKIVWKHLVNDLGLSGDDLEQELNRVATKAKRDDVLRTTSHC